MKKIFQDDKSVQQLSMASMVKTESIALTFPTVSIHSLAHFDKLPNSAHIRLPVVTNLFGCSRATIWRWVKNKKIPAPKRFGERVSAWNVGDLRAVLGPTAPR